MNFQSIRKKIESHSRFSYNLLRLVQKAHFLYPYHRILVKKRRKSGIYGQQFADFYNEHRDRFKKVYDMLADDKSKLTYKNVLKFRQTGNIKLIDEVKVIPAYFVDILPKYKHEIFVDGGAYLGESTLDFIKWFGNMGGYFVYLWEPDKPNIKLLKRNLIKTNNYEIIPYGMWSKHETLSFTSTSGGDDSRINDKSILTANGKTVKIEVESIDNLLYDKGVTFIKMDVEGAEIKALEGARKIICEQKPKLAISIYHKFDHYYKIPLMIKEWVPEYRIYMRHHSDLHVDTIMYAIPENI